MPGVKELRLDVVLLRLLPRSVFLEWIASGNNLRASSDVPIDESSSSNPACCCQDYLDHSFHTHSSSHPPCTGREMGLHIRTVCARNSYTLLLQFASFLAVLWGTPYMLCKYTERPSPPYPIHPSNNPFGSRLEHGPGPGPDRPGYQQYPSPKGALGSRKKGKQSEKIQWIEREFNTKSCLSKLNDSLCCWDHTKLFFFLRLPRAMPGLFSVIDLLNFLSPKLCMRIFRGGN